MTIKILKIFIFLIVTYFFQINFITGLFYPLNVINIFLPILVFFIVLFDEKVVMSYALVFAVFQTMLSSSPVLLSLFILPASAMILLKIYYKFFTNKSIYSILFLNFLMLFIFHVLNTVSFFIYHFYQYKTLEAAVNYNILLDSFVWQVILSSVFVIIAFIVINLLSNRLKTVFVDTSF